MTVVRLYGEYDVSRRDELDRLLDRVGDAEPLTIDFLEVACIDTAALRSLVRFQRARREAGRSPLILTGVSARVKEFFEISKAEGAFDIR